MIVTANTLSSVNYVTGTWKTELGLWFSSIYVLQNYAYDPVVGNAELTSTNITIAWYLCLYHTFNLLIKVYG
jgi:hypothetical protein